MRIAYLTVMIISAVGMTNERIAYGDDTPATGQGVMVGEVTDSSALVQVRLTDGDRPVDGDLPGLAGTVHFTLSQADSGIIVDRKQIAVAATRDFIARAAFDGLSPETRYACGIRIGSTAADLRPAAVAKFRTLPGRESATPVRFVVVTGMNYAKFHGDNRIDRERHLVQNNTKLPTPYAGRDRQRGYPALESILRLRPDFFVGTGDNVYYDTPRDPRAETVDDMRRKWHQQFAQPRYRDLFAAVPTYWMVDDHDFRIDDCDNTGDYLPSPEQARTTLLEQLPYAPLDAEDVKTYRTHRVSKDLQIWFPENRMHRSPNATPDGPEKSIWGTEQKAWLRRTLTESDATFKLLISPTPMIGPDDRRKTDNHTNIGGFRHERDEFFAWLRETGISGLGFGIVCGDRHWQYHSIDPSGIEEFSCGALVDANSRPGRLPGDPASTDPDALIRQPYTQEEPSGGFLMIECQPGDLNSSSVLRFVWYDENGRVLHRHEKTIAKSP